eukprot:476369_1
MTGIYNSLYLFVYGLHAQYNDNLLVEAIISYHVAIKEVPTAIMYWHSSIAFFDLGYYAMSLKLLERAYRMTPEIPTIAHGYALKRLSLVNIISKRCSNCGNDKQRFRACMGCCQVYYCNRKCQKQHWNKVHRNICNGKFGVIIKVITNNCLNLKQWKQYHKQLQRLFPKHISKEFYIKYYRKHTNKRDRHV